MNTRSVDENILEGQRRLLQKWGIPFRQIGVEIGRKGMDDRELAWVARLL